MADIRDARFKIGDWICWQSNGSLAYGEVRFIRDAWPRLSHLQYVTDNGAVGEDSILEARSRTPDKGDSR